MLIKWSSKTAQESSKSGKVRKAYKPYKNKSAKKGLVEVSPDSLGLSCIQLHPALIRVFTEARRKVFLDPTIQRAIDITEKAVLRMSKYARKRKFRPSIALPTVENGRMFAEIQFAHLVKSHLHHPDELKVILTCMAILLPKNLDLWMETDRLLTKLLSSVFDISPNKASLSASPFLDLELLLIANYVLTSSQEKMGLRVSYQSTPLFLKLVMDDVIIPPSSSSSSTAAATTRNKQGKQHSPPNNLHSPQPSSSQQKQQGNNRRVVDYLIPIDPVSSLPSSSSSSYSKASSIKASSSVSSSSSSTSSSLTSTKPRHTTIFDLLPIMEEEGSPSSSPSSSTSAVFFASIGDNQVQDNRPVELLALTLHLFRSSSAAAYSSSSSSSSSRLYGQLGEYALRVLSAQNPVKLVTLQEIWSIIYQLPLPNAYLLYRKLYQQIYFSFTANDYQISLYHLPPAQTILSLLECMKYSQVKSVAMLEKLQEIVLVSSSSSSPSVAIGSSLDRVSSMYHELIDMACFNLLIELEAFSFAQAIFNHLMILSSSSLNDNDINGGIRLASFAKTPASLLYHQVRKVNVGMKYKVSTGKSSAKRVEFSTAGKQYIYQRLLANITAATTSMTATSAPSTPSSSPSHTAVSGTMTAAMVGMAAGPIITTTTTTASSSAVASDANKMTSVDTEDIPATTTTKTAFLGVSKSDLLLALFCFNRDEGYTPGYYSLLERIEHYLLPTMTTTTTTAAVAEHSMMMSKKDAIGLFASYGSQDRFYPEILGRLTKIIMMHTNVTIDNNNSKTTIAADNESLAMKDFTVPFAKPTTTTSSSSASASTASTSTSASNKLTIKELESLLWSCAKLNYHPTCLDDWVEVYYLHQLSLAKKLTNSSNNNYTLLSTQGVIGLLRTLWALAVLEKLGPATSSSSSSSSLHHGFFANEEIRHVLYQSLTQGALPGGDQKGWVIRQLWQVYTEFTIILQKLKAEEEERQRQLLLQQLDSKMTEAIADSNSSTSISNNSGLAITIQKYEEILQELSEYLQRTEVKKYGVNDKPSLPFKDHKKKNTTTFALLTKKTSQGEAGAAAATTITSLQATSSQQQQPPPVNSSHHHLDVSRMLSEMGISHENEKEVVNGYFVDIFIPIYDKKTASTAAVDHHPVLQSLTDTDLYKEKKRNVNYNQLKEKIINDKKKINNTGSVRSEDKDGQEEDKDKIKIEETETNEVKTAPELQQLTQQDQQQKKRISGIILEFDGPFHYETYLKLPTGPTMMKRRHLQAYGYQLISLPYWSYHMKMSTEVKQANLRKLLESLQLTADQQQQEEQEKL